MQNNLIFNISVNEPLFFQHKSAKIKLREKRPIAKPRTFKAANISRCTVLEWIWRAQSQSRSAQRCIYWPSKNFWDPTWSQYRSCWRLSLSAGHHLSLLSPHYRALQSECPSCSPSNPVDFSLQWKPFDSNVPAITPQSHNPGWKCCKNEISLGHQSHRHQCPWPPSH